MDTKYINTDNITNQDDLYQALIDVVQPITNEVEAQEAVLVKEYEEKIKAETDEYNEAIAPAVEKAKKSLEPARKAMDDKALEIKNAATKKINALVDKYVAHQETIQGHFDQNTKVHYDAWQEAIKPEKDAHNERVAALQADMEETLKPINEEYQALAKIMDEHDLESVETE